MRSLVFLIRDILIILIYRIFCHYDIKILIKSSAIQNNLVILPPNFHLFFEHLKIYLTN